MTHVKKAVVLSSGGIDSTTAMAIAKHEGFKIYSLSFFYGQRHAFELDAAKKVANAIGVTEHLVINIDLKQIGGSSLTDDIDVPKDRDEQEMVREIPVTYVPARNTIFLSFALAWAEVLESSDIFIGVNAKDYSGYPDCRPSISTHLNAWPILQQRQVWKALQKSGLGHRLFALPKHRLFKRELNLGLTMH